MKFVPRFCLSTCRGSWFAWTICLTPMFGTSCFIAFATTPVCGSTSGPRNFSFAFNYRTDVFSLTLQRFSHSFLLSLEIRIWYIVLINSTMEISIDWSLVWLVQSCENMVSSFMIMRLTLNQWLVAVENRSISGCITASSIRFTILGSSRTKTPGAIHKTKIGACLLLLGTHTQ